MWDMVVTSILIRPFAVQPRRKPATIADRLIPTPSRGGRDAAIDVSGRFETERRKEFDNGRAREEPAERLAAGVTFERPKRVITRNNSPNIAFDRSIDPYRGCEHGCFYCFARPNHVHLGLPAGLDLESRLIAIEGAAELLERELASASYWPATVAFGVNADPYQPIERQYRITRSLLATLQRARHPLSIVTKSNLILRDLDILSAMGRERLVKVFVSVATLDQQVARRMEPRAPTPQKRLEAIEVLNDAGVPAGVVVAPIIPAINDAEIETILTRAYSAGAREASYAVLRLPHELRDVFRERLLAHYPAKLRRAISLIQSMDDDTDGDRPMSGSGAYDWMVKRRFETAARRLGYRETPATLRADLFRKPAPAANEARAHLIAGARHTEPRGWQGRLPDRILGQR